MTFLIKRKLRYKMNEKNEYNILKINSELIIRLN